MTPQQEHEDRRQAGRRKADCEQRNMRQAVVGALECAALDLPTEYRHILRPHIERAMDMGQQLPKPTIWQRLGIYIFGPEGA